MLLITAANGNQGKLLVPKLLVAGVPFRACVQSGRSEAVLRGLGVQDVIVGDLTNRDVLSQALAGVDSVYYIGPVLRPTEREMGLAAVEMAEAAGVSHFVFSSALHSITTALIQHEIKRDVEERLLLSTMSSRFCNRPTICYH